MKINLADFTQIDKITFHLSNQDKVTVTKAETNEIEISFDFKDAKIKENNEKTLKHFNEILNKADKIAQINRKDLIKQNKKEILKEENDLNTYDSLKTFHISQEMVDKALEKVKEYTTNEEKQKVFNSGKVCQSTDKGQNNTYKTKISKDIQNIAISNLKAYRAKRDKKN